MTTTRRSLFKSLAAFVCGLFFVTPTQAKVTPDVDEVYLPHSVGPIRKFLVDSASVPNSMPVFDMNGIPEIGSEWPFGHWHHLPPTMRVVNRSVFRFSPGGTWIVTCVYSGIDSDGWCESANGEPSPSPSYLCRMVGGHQFVGQRLIVAGDPQWVRGGGIVMHGVTHWKIHDVH